MSTHGRQVVPRRASPRPCRVNRFGDLVCPNCRANFITPWHCDVLAGQSRCPLCKAPFRVTTQAARRANALAEVRWISSIRALLGGHHGL